MKTARKTKLRFANMPADYAALCGIFLPRPIHDKVDFENAVEIADVFAGFEDAMSADQTDYFDLLCTLIEAYEAPRVKRPKVTALQMLKHLLAESDMSATDLSRLLGSHRTLGAMIQRGERNITAGHARILGKHFGLSAGVFIE